MMKPSSLPDGTPKPYSRKDAKVSSRSAMSVSEFLVLTTMSST
jgi:hypothetical protein